MTVFVSCASRDRKAFKRLTGILAVIGAVVSAVFVSGCGGSVWGSVLDTKFQPCRAFD